MCIRDSVRAVGTAQANYERTAGHGDKDDTSITAPIAEDVEFPENFRGNAELEYLAVVGTGDTFTTWTFDAYQASVGTAVTNYERVAGHGDKDDTNSSTQVALDADGNTIEFPENFIGNAELQRQDDLDPADTGTDASTPTTSIDGLEAFSMSTNNVLECANASCAVIGDVTWVKFVEDDSNESTFTNTEDTPKHTQHLSLIHI